MGFAMKNQTILKICLTSLCLISLAACGSKRNFDSQSSGRTFNPPED